MTEDLMKVNEVSKFLKLKPARVYELCRTDKNFPFILIGQRQYRFSKTALMNWIEQGGNKNKAVKENA